MTGRPALKAAIVSLGPFERVGRLHRLCKALGALPDTDAEIWLFSLADDPASCSPSDVSRTFFAPSHFSRRELWLYRVYRAMRGGLARLPFPFWRAFNRLDPIYRRLRKLIEMPAGDPRGEDPPEFDVIIAHGLMALPLGMLAQHLYGGRLIYDVTEYFTEQYSDKWLWRLLEKPFVERCEAWFAPRVAAMIAPSPGYLDASLKQYNLSLPSAVVKNTSDILASPLPSSNGTPPAADSNVVICYQGLAHENRGLSTYVESSLLWPDNTRLVLQLAGDQRRIGLLRALIEKYGLQKRVRIIPPATALDNALVKALSDNRVDLGLCCFEPRLPQLQYSLPNKLFSYISAGIPVIGIRGTAVGDFIEETGMGLVIPSFDAKSLAGGITDLVSPPAHLERLRAHVHRNRAAYSWQNEQKNLHHLLETVLSLPAPPQA